ncbi:hypothetical protein TNCT_312451 [Trichonephila clavata]|uniref:Uncharacterized protein n=1 Tax=Trichonephila clavata TaxID=2740835 RepID=A0A8X6LKH8_TRICU|nr:hypothetical protein TNCT_312451 [Trichonephila clavata]
MLNIGLKFKTFTGIGEVTPLRRVEISCDENKAPIINALDENSLLVQPVRTRVYGTANKQPILSKKKRQRQSSSATLIMIRSQLTGFRPMRSLNSCLRKISG